MIWEVGTLLKYIVLPPLGLAWLVVLAWLVLRNRPRMARWLLASALLFGYLLATPLVSDALMRAVMVDTAQPAGVRPQAIVVLGGGRVLALDGAGKVIEAYPSPYTLERMLTGARLQKHTGLPLLVAGGNPDGRGWPEGAVMRDFLVRDFGVPVRWVEEASRNTVENAIFSAQLLRTAGVHTVYLVTHDFHMRRARLLFEAQGLTVVPFNAQQPMVTQAPVGPVAPAQFSVRELVPTMSGLTGSFLACNESAGLLYALLKVKLAA